MNIVIVGAMAGGASGAIGYFLAGKLHGHNLGNKIYPLYSLVLFSSIIFAFKIYS